MTTALCDEGRLVTSGLDGANDLVHFPVRARAPVDRGASFFQPDVRAGDTGHVLDSLGHMPGAIVAVHAGDGELGYEELAGDRFGGMTFRVRVHRPDYLSTPAVTVKFALTRRRNFH